MHFWRHERIECDGCQKGENSIALEHSKKRHWPKVKISFKIGRTKYLCVCRRMKLTGRGVHSEKVGERGRRWVLDRRDAVKHYLLLIRVNKWSYKSCEQKTDWTTLKVKTTVSLCSAFQVQHDTPFPHPNFLPFKECIISCSTCIFVFTALSFSSLSSKLHEQSFFVLGNILLFFGGSIVRASPPLPAYQVASTNSFKSAFEIK